MSTTAITTGETSFTEVFVIPGERLHDFNIGLMSSPPGEGVVIAPNAYDVIYHQTEAVPNGEMLVAESVDNTLSGRYVVIQLLGNSDPLTLCEVSVHVCGGEYMFLNSAL